jgi:ubiquinone/menaquinone biosynthesis C-methylase UbiE
MLVAGPGSGAALRFPFPRRLQRQERNTDREFRFLCRRFTPRTVFMEVGGGDCELALRAAGYVERVYAVDVSGQFIQRVLVPCNLRLVLCNGVRIPVAEGSVDVAFSAGFIDQLHPEDALEHLESVLRALAPGGEYICMTGSPRELRPRLLQAGFSRVRFYAGAARIPGAISSLIPEKLLRLTAIK